MTRHSAATTAMAVTVGRKTAVRTIHRAGAGRDRTPPGPNPAPPKTGVAPPPGAGEIEAPPQRRDHRHGGDGGQEDRGPHDPQVPGGAFEQQRESETDHDGPEGLAGRED